MMLRTKCVLLYSQSTYVKFGALELGIKNTATIITTL